MPLTDIQIRRAKPTEKKRKLADGGGLTLVIHPNGTKTWVYRYRLDDKPNDYSIGIYPDVSLAAAREERDKAWELVKKGKHPGRERKARKAAEIREGKNTFKSVGDEWLQNMKDKKRKDNKTPFYSPGYLNQIEGVLLSDIYPAIGAKPIRTITTPDIFTDIIAKQLKRGAEIVAINTRQYISRIYKFAQMSGKANHNPASALQGEIKRPKIEHAQPFHRDQIKQLLINIKRYNGYRKTVICMRLLLYVFLRNIEIRRAKWAMFDFADALMECPPEIMKKERRHLVPLSRQAVALLKELHEITGNAAYLFPNNRRPKEMMSATTLNAALKRMGFDDKSAHDFRATASTHLNEMRDTEGRRMWDEDAIEMQLAHAEEDSARASYNHALYLDERRRMMQHWADWIDAIEAEISEEDRVPPPKGRRAHQRVIDRVCPHCGCDYVTSHGNNTGVRRYQCSTCRKTFNDNTVRRLSQQAAPSES